MILKPLSARNKKQNVARSGISRFDFIMPSARESGVSDKRRGKANIFATGLCLLLVSNSLSICQALPAEAKSSSKKSSKAEPVGTLLHPLVPKLDDSAIDTSLATPSEAAKSVGGSKFATPIHSSLEYDMGQVQLKKSDPGNTSGVGSPVIGEADKAKVDIDNETGLRREPEKILAETGKTSIDESSLTINEDTTLKGTIQIVADDTEYDQVKNTFLGTGNAVALIAGENSKLEADMILYDQNTEQIDARGNVRIFRDGQLTTGSAFKFKVTSDEYLITNPDTEVQGTTVVARKGYGTAQGLSFKDGTMQMDKPIYITSNIGFAPVNYQEVIGEKRAHPESFLPENQSFKFSARKMVYERYKEQGNLTVFGGRLMFGKLGIPLGKFTATVGQANNVTFPVTPYLGNNMMSGGLNVGPNFHRALGKYGVLSYAPLLQFGARRLTGETTTTSNLPGVGGQIGFTNARLQAHVAYGSNSDLLVGDLKYKIRKNLRFQGGINRFLEDGIYGFRRARAIAEVVDDHRFGNIPFLANLNFRTAAGWMQDNPQLINLTPEFAELFNQTTSTRIVSGYRLSEQITANTHPIFKIGNEKWGLSSNLSGGIGLRAYSSGDAMAMAQIGPNLEVMADRFKLRVGYTQSVIRGESPFVFDQFIQGTRSANVAAGYKVSKYLTVGGSIGYNLVDRLAFSRSLTAAIGPEDFKVLLTRDFLRGNQRIGFDVLYGQRIPFNRLVLKGGPDHGQLGGI